MDTDARWGCKDFGARARKPSRQKGFRGLGVSGIGDLRVERLLKDLVPSAGAVGRQIAFRSCMGLSFTGF